MSRICPKCGNSDWDTYCTKCGTKLEPRPKCSKCGRTLYSNDKFCGHCGEEILLKKGGEKGA